MGAVEWSNPHRGYLEAVNFPLIEALLGRRSRRFSLGASLPNGPLAFTSRHAPVPLDDLESMMVLTAVAGNTGWHHMIYGHERYAPHLSNYSVVAGGRTFPSAAGFHTAEFFYTDDSGVYFFPTREMPGAGERSTTAPADLGDMVARHRQRVRKLADGRLHIPPEEPYMERHNTWCVNRPGSLLVIPVADLAQHMLAVLSFLLQNGYVMYDDINNEPIPGLEPFKDMANVDEPYPLTIVEQFVMSEATAELATACYAGALMLQAMGLGGWMFDGIGRFTILGASGDPEVPGLGFHVATDERWSVPNPTGLPGAHAGTPVLGLTGPRAPSPY